MGIPKNIDALLVKFDLKPESLARIAGVSTATVSRWRTGQTDNIRKANLERICEQLELSPDDILSSSVGLAAKEHGRVPSGAKLPSEPRPAYAPPCSGASTRATPASPTSSTTASPYPTRCARPTRTATSSRSRATA